MKTVIETNLIVKHNGFSSDRLTIDTDDINPNLGE